MKLVIRTFLVLSLMGLFACGKKGQAVLASSQGVEIKSSAVAKIFKDLPEQNKAELQSNKDAFINFTKNTVSQLASIDIIALKAKAAGVENSSEYKSKVNLGAQELLIRIFVGQKFTAKEEDLTDEQLKQEYDKIKASRSEEELANFPEFEAVKAKIKQQLVSQKAQAQFQAFVNPLAENVQIDDANIKKVAKDFFEEKDLDSKVVISRVEKAQITVEDLLLSLGDISLPEVRKQVKSQEDAEQFFSKSAENLGINLQIVQIAKDEGIESGEQYVGELKEIEKILLVNIFVKNELFAGEEIQRSAVEAEYKKIKENNQDIGSLDEVYDRIEAELLAARQESLVMNYLESLKKEIVLDNKTIDEFVYDNLSSEAQEAWDKEKQEAAAASATSSDSAL